MLKRLKRAARTTLEAISAVRPRHWDAFRINRLQAAGAIKPVAPSMVHLRQAIEWLKRAQDQIGNGGVSWGYCARRPVLASNIFGWRPAYPETTGYIIETLLRYGHLAADPDCRERARRMADWETRIQLPDGGIQGGYLGSGIDESSTFVTGQVIFGWLAAFQEFDEPAYLDAACRAGDFLATRLDDRGRFIAGYSRFCAAGPKAYEARSGWALAQLGQITRNDRYTAAARLIGRYAVSCQQPNGWFADNDLDDHAIPLTHTIGYVLEGLLETGLILNEPSFLDAVTLTLTNLQHLIGDTGFLPGRWTKYWEPAVTSCCLTGSCQLACVYFRMHRLNPARGFEAAGRKLLSFVTGTQLSSGVPGCLVGGIHGSYPFDGDYAKYALPNWATKFYADAIMDWFSITGRSNDNEKMAILGSSGRFA